MEEIAMCKHKNQRIDMPILAAEGAYEGRTMRLDRADRSVDRRSEHGSAGRGGFPWWTLWLVWPLIGLAKWFVPLYIGAVTPIGAQLSAAGAAPFVAFALIAVGLVLIFRR
jgi:hypothetical protein